MGPVPQPKVSRPSKNIKGGTPSTRRHKFESFTQRIAKLNIDPVRRARRQDADIINHDSSTTHFKTGVDSWRDINLSKNFTTFVKEVEPFCDSLAGVLYHQQKILDLLVHHIERGDVLSLEPLLSLTSHLSHDLGARFEIHFARVTTLVTSLAARDSNAEVIEWSFTCLAWLFKYLSRLLVPDLRPVFDIMLPLLGIGTQKPHVARFAGEALSFLVRKAATVYSSRKEPLALLLRHIKDDLGTRKGQDISLYQEGLMTMLADSMKAPEMALHSKAENVYLCLLDLLEHTNEMTDSAFLDVLYGVTVNLIHHSNAGSFETISDVICDSWNDRQNHPVQSISAYGHLLFIVVAVRRASRIQKWESVCDSIIALLRASLDGEANTSLRCLPSAHMALAVAFQYAPLDVVTPRLRSAMDIVSSKPNTLRYLPFCTYFSDIGKERFQSLLLPFFLK